MTNSTVKLTELECLLRIYGMLLETETGPKEMSAAKVPVSYLFANLFFAVAETCAGLDLNQINLDNMGEGSHNRGASSASAFLNPPSFLADIAGGSAVNIGGGYSRGGTSQNPSRAYFHFVSLWRLIVSWTGTDLLKNASRDHLGQYGRSPSYCAWTIEDITASTQRPIRTTRARALLVSIL